ncbi:SDR family oxidoreductase [candidate division KSB1 bacterium]|nr:SDR family oxidoreductase [candidate division KSB1 bacterium]
MKNDKWSTEDISDQQGRLAIVTGANSGLGYEIAQTLAKKNATVILAVRNMDRGKRAAEKIKNHYSQADISVLELDLANLESIRAFTKEFLRANTRLDILINNAGVMIPPYSKTADGFELQFGTNHLGHFALTGLLLNILQKTQASRVVSVSSMAHRMGDIDFDDLNWEKRTYRRWRAYGDSKIANIYFTNELDRKLTKNGNNPLAVAAHPGYSATDLQRYSKTFTFFNRFIAQSSYMGALPILYAALAEDVKGGDFYGPYGFMEISGYPAKTQPSKLAQNEEIARRLWEKSEELTGVYFS